MSLWESVVFIVSGAGTFAFILGIFFGLYARQNGRATREFIAAGNTEMRDFIAAQHKDMRDFIAAQHMDMREFLGRTLERLGERISEEGEKTREEIRRPRG